MTIELEPVRTFGPGELLAWLRQQGPPPRPGSVLDRAGAWLERIPEAATPARLPGHVTDPLAELSELEPALELFRGRRARPGYRGWLAGGSLLLFDEATGAVELVTEVETNQLLDWLASPLDGFREPDIDLARLPPLPADAVAVLLLLGDLFRARYPDPDPRWAPDGRFRFRLEELTALGARPDPHSLITAWRRVTATNLPAADEETIAEQLAVLALWELVGRGPTLAELDDDSRPADAPDEWWLGEPLTWLVRCLAWWNHLLAVESGHGQLQLLQATALWSLARDAEDERHWDLVPTSPAAVRARLDELAAPGDDVCPACGRTNRPDARFCGGCGLPLAGSR